MAAIGADPVYRSLSVSRREIRVLNVHSTLVDGLVSVSLEYVSVYDADYHAISWAWGDPTQRGSVLVDGQKLNVPANAVKVLRELVIPHGYRTIWLDAVSINQADINERADQVRIMKEIYSMAENVLVWLGPDEGFAESAIRSVLLIEQHCRDNTNDLKDYENTLWVGTSDRRRRWWSYEPLTPFVDWPAIQHLYGVPLLNRVWIIQEISLAKEPICFYGSRALPWSSIGIAAEWMIHRNYERKEYSGVFIRGVMNCAIICTVKRGVKDMDRLLRYSAQFDATESRDKVYGLAGLMPSSDAQSLEKPDYNLPIAHVFTAATRDAIWSSQRLGILGSTWIGRSFLGSDDNLPSWVPNYAAKWGRGPKLIRNFSRKGCSNQLPLILDGNTHPAVLRVQGVVVDRISTVFGPIDEVLLDDRTSLAKFMQYILQAILKTQTGTTAFDIMFESLITRYYNEDGSKSAMETMRADFEAFLHVCQECWSEESGIPTPPVRTHNAASADRFKDHLRVTNLHRFIFVTVGGVAGQAASEPSTGDALCILFGNDIPFILRPFQNEFRLLGQAYMPGIMNGEYIRELQDRNALYTQNRWFDIR